MEENEALVVRFVRWWSNDIDEDLSLLLADGFVCDSGLGPLGRDDFRSAHRGAGQDAIKGLKIVSVISSTTDVSVMFEYTDTITNLYHRCCWHVLIGGGVVTRIWGCSAIIPRPEDVARSEEEVRRALAARGIDDQ